MRACTRRTGWYKKPGSEQKKQNLICRLFLFININPNIIDVPHSKHKKQHNHQHFQTNLRCGGNTNKNVQTEIQFLKFLRLYISWKMVIKKEL